MQHKLPSAPLGSNTQTTPSPCAHSPLLQERRFAQLEDARAARESKREAYLVVS